YSTVHDKYYMDENQFTMSLDLAGDPVKTPAATTRVPRDTKAPESTATPDKDIIDATQANSTERNTVIAIAVISGAVLIIGASTTTIIIQKKKKK
ncbi:MAG: hypothetical protein IKL40_04800, partial [Clostridia bacterium]|nr:hypothetical protein [Clostridia bacterium]